MASNSSSWVTNSMFSSGQLNTSEVSVFELFYLTPPKKTGYWAQPGAKAFRESRCVEGCGCGCGCRGELVGQIASPTLGNSEVVMGPPKSFQDGGSDRRKRKSLYVCLPLN
jgi:hypothetical protein